MEEGPAEYGVWYSTSTAKGVKAGGGRERAEEEDKEEEEEKGEEKEEGKGKKEEEKGKKEEEEKGKKEEETEAHTQALEICRTYPPVFNDTQLACPGLCLHSLAYQVTWL
jgi:hypothetical protein